MGIIFGEKLKEHRESVGVSGYRITQVTGIPGPTLVAIEKGRRPPSDANLRDLAAFDELKLGLEDLRLWLDLDRVGAEGLERIRRHLERERSNGQSGNGA